jgi:hypothetical protein
MSANILSEKESMDVLREEYREHAADCCPSIPSFAQRVATFDEIVGVYPVIHDRTEKIRESIHKLIDFCRYKKTQERLTYQMTDFLRWNILERIGQEDFMNNTIPKNLFDQLKDEIKKQENMDNFYSDEKVFELIKKSSPKLSNLILSLAKFYEPNEDPNNNQVVKDYNDRGSNKNNEMEMVISTEPHRIAGMSAFGKFTSCQDWVRKHQGHEYHDYTHQVWANLKDETCGIIFIRHTDEEYEVEDMYARSLIRVLELENGHKVFYIHKIYAIAPYDKYLQDSIEAWVKTLPENYHAILMYKHDRSTYEGMKNKHGKTFKSSFTSVTHEQDALVCYGEERQECDCCEGSGTVTQEYENEVERDCWSCDGSGYIWDDDLEENVMCHNCDGDGYTVETEWQEEEVDCENCDGSGYVLDDEREYSPYNDHTNFLDLESYKGIKFQVPTAILKWDEEEEPTKPIDRPTPTGIYQVGDRVKLRDGLIVGQMYGGIIMYDGMMNYMHKVMEIKLTSTEGGTTYYGCGYWYSAEMLEPAPIQEGDYVRIRHDLVVGQMYNGLTFQEAMKHNQIVKVLRKDSNDTFKVYHPRIDWLYYGVDMLQPVAQNARQLREVV